MRCPKCGTENREGAKFCKDCAAPIPGSCANCGATLQPGSKFCDQCGSPVSGVVASSKAASTPSVLVLPEAAAASAAAGERKTVTALFADIKGSTELEQDIDPEEARALVDPVLELMIDAVRRYDGFVVQSTGDGIFALFGAPLAHEDHPQRALYAALRMQEESRRYGARLQSEGRAPIEIRAGINTGEVVVRAIATGAGQVEYTPIGHTTNLASRLQGIARSGSIVVSGATRRLCEGYFTLNALGATRVKGVNEPVSVYEVTGLGPLRTRLQRSAGRGLTKFVGRERQMEALTRAAEQARSGHGQIAAAMAEAGTGKSRLFFEFKALSRSGWLVLETFSISHGRASAYLPVIELLHGYFGIDAGDDGRRRREKVAGRIAILDRALEDTLPWLFGLLGIGEGDEAFAQADPQVAKRRTLEAVKRILLRESLNQPVMVIFEDLHWIDDQTQQFLNLLADSIATAQLLLLVNYRPGYTHPWNSRTYYTQLRLDPLGRESAGEMLNALLGDGDDLAALKRLIIEKTEGVPFFMEETVQVLLDEGALVRNGRVKLTRRLAELTIPPTVQAILAARIDRLPVDAKDLLQTLAVIGREFPVSLIRAVTTRSDDEIDRLLGDLQLGEFIYEQPALGDTRYVFKHALTQEVAYNSVLLERRKILHERIGGALEALYAGSIDEHLAELAHHYGRSANLDAAVEYLTRAGKQKMEEARQVERSMAEILSAQARGDRPMTADEERATIAAIHAARDRKSGAIGQRETVPGSVESIWRYPIKSMAGERILAARLTTRGVLGDRVYALIDVGSNRAATVRTWAAALLGYQAQFLADPEPGAPPPNVQITVPDGPTLSTADPDIHERLSAAFGRKLSLMTTAPTGLLVELTPGTVGGAWANVTDFPLGATAPPGAFFDYACLHLVATATLGHLQKVYPEGRFDVRRFRPNIVIDSEAEPFVENSWVGRRLAIGEEAVLRITIPCPRCVNMILPQADLPHDPGILRTIAQHNMQDLGDFGTLPCAGVYADVLKPGTIRRGDAVHWLD
jgi:class 3 adenylate cyclase/uncharacterized protein YcbX